MPATGSESTTVSVNNSTQPVWHFYCLPPPTAWPASKLSGMSTSRFNAWEWISRRCACHVFCPAYDSLAVKTSAGALKSLYCGRTCRIAIQLNGDIRHRRIISVLHLRRLILNHSLSSSMTSVPFSPPLQLHPMNLSSPVTLTFISIILQTVSPLSFYLFSLLLILVNMSTSLRMIKITLLI